jgi:hypothetical protein
VKKLTAAWEKKNSKTARAGGASLMALSLAACGGEDNTPFSAADVSAAETAAAATATTAALTGADGTVYASVDAAVTSNDTAIADAATAAVDITTDNQAAIDAAVAAVDLTTDNAAAIDAAVAADTAFASLADFVAAYDALVAPVSSALTDDDATGVAPDAPSMSSGNDVLTATDETFDAADVIVDGSTTDADTLTIDTATDLSATPTVMNVETVNVNATGTLASGNTTLTVDVAGFSGTNTFNFDATGAGTLIASLDIDNADSGSYVASADFTDIDIAADTDADLVVTVAADAVIDTTGAADDLTIHGGGFDVDLNSSAATEDLVIDGAVDLTVDSMTALVGNATLSASNDVDAEVDAAEGNFTVTAGRDVTLASADAAEGDVTVTAGRDITDIDAGAATGDVTVTAGRDIAAISVESAEGTVSVTAGGTIALTTATAAATVILDNTGATAGDDITITDANSAESVTVTSVGNVTATANTGLAAAESITITAAEASSITADSTTEAQSITLNAAEPDGDAIVFTLAANDVETLTLGGSSAIIVGIDSGDISTETVTSSNAVSAMLDYTVATASDVTAVAASVVQNLGADFDNITLTVDDDANIKLDTEVAQTAGTAAVIFDHETNATASTSTSFTLGINDSNTANATADATATVAGLTFTDIQNLTIATGELNLDSSADITGADLETVTVTGSGTFDLNGNTITGDGTNRVTLDASALEGVLTMALDGTTDGVAAVTAGSAADVITIDGVSGAAAGFSVTGGAGADSVTVTVNGDGGTAIISYDGGTGSDSITLNNTVDISDSTVTLTSVEIIDLADAASVSSDLVSGNSFIIDGVNGTTNDLTVIVDATTVDLSGLAFTSDASEATDNIVLDGSGNAVSITLTGSSILDNITGGTGSDTIVAGGGADIVIGGTGGDTIDLTESTSAADDVRFTDTGEGSAVGVATQAFSGYDVITGFTTTVDDIDHNEAAFAGQALTFVIANTAAAVAASDLAAADFADVDSVVTFLNDGTVEDTLAANSADYVLNEDFLVGVTLGNGTTAIYEVMDATAATLVAADVALVAHVDATLVIGDFI